MIKLVAFDWNGTILADTIACLKADDAALISLGYKPIGLTKFRQTFEIPVVNFYKKLGYNLDSLGDKIVASEEIFHKTYDQYSQNVRTRPGARSLLKWLQKENIKSIVLSNHVTEKIQGHLKRLKIENYFEEVIANSHLQEALFKKGKGEKLKDYIRKLHLEPSEVLIVGDTTEEIEIAHEIGAISVALTHGYNSTRRLKAAKPDYLFGDLRQVEGIITRVNKDN